MADYDSSLPIRTENAGDVIAKIADATTPSQQLAVDSSGKITTKIQTSSGGNLTATGTSLDVQVGNTVTVQATNLDIRDLAAATDSVAAHLKDGAGTSITSSAAGANRVLHTQNLDSSGNILGTTAAPLVVASSVNPEGAEVNDYNSGAAVAANATSTHDYTVPAAVSHYCLSVRASASGKMKIEVQVEGPASTFTTKFVGFNSTANPDIFVDIKSPLVVATGLKVRVIRTNLDKSAQDLYSTISGQNL